MRAIAWPDDVAGAKALQEALRKKVKFQPLKESSEIVAGADAAFSGDIISAAVSLFSYPDMNHIEDVVVRVRVEFPYVPGYLSFREGPAILRAFERLVNKPDLILFDGQGIAHPRGIGIASHIGVILNIPAIGCAKSRLIGEYDEPDRRRGSWKYLYHDGKKVGAVLRTRDDVRPIFVSPGHLIDIKSSIDVVMNCVRGFRLPEPLRRADHISKGISRSVKDPARSLNL